MICDVRGRKSSALHNPVNNPNQIQDIRLPIPCSVRDYTETLFGGLLHLVKIRSAAIRIINNPFILDAVWRLASLYSTLAVMRCLLIRRFLSNVTATDMGAVACAMFSSRLAVSISAQSMRYISRHMDTLFTGWPSLFMFCVNKRHGVQPPGTAQATRIHRLQFSQSSHAKASMSSVDKAWCGLHHSLANQTSIGTTGKHQNPPWVSISNPRIVSL